MNNLAFPILDGDAVPGWDNIVHDALYNLALEWITTPESSYGWADCDIYAAALENAKANGRKEPNPTDKVIALAFVLSGQLELMGKCKPWGGE